jgi:hypothetical protein
MDEAPEDGVSAGTLRERMSRVTSAVMKGLCRMVAGG